MMHAVIAATSGGSAAGGGTALGAFVGIGIVRALYNATPRRRAIIARQRAQKAAMNTWKAQQRQWQALQQNPSSEQEAKQNIIRSLPSGFLVPPPPQKRWEEMTIHERGWMLAYVEQQRLGKV